MILLELYYMFIVILIPKKFTPQGGGGVPSGEGGEGGAAGAQPYICVYLFMYV